MKNLLITGATGNLGKTILAALEKEEGFHINITCREEVPGTEHLKAFHVDLMNETAAADLVQEIMETQGQLDAVIFLTGAYVSGDITQSTSSDLQKMMGVNVITAHNIARSLMQWNRQHPKPLQLIFIGAKAAMDNHSAIHHVAYALSKKMLFEYCNLINQSEHKNGTLAHILLPGTLDTAFNREAMPEADFSQWTKPADIAACLLKILSGEERNTVIQL